MIGEPFCPPGGAPVAVALEISRARRVAATQRFITLASTVAYAA
jgi:hypothetical protein